MKLKILVLSLALMAVSCFAFLIKRGNLHLLGIGIGSQPAIPKALVLEDYQTPEDARFMRWLGLIEQSGAGKRMDAELIKPLIDDANTQKLAVQAVEATPSQFSQLDQAVRVCARILRVQKPRVFVCQHADFPITIENYADPVIVVGASTLQQFKAPDEMRFLVGRELAHIAAGHVRWISLIRQTTPMVENSSFIGRAAASTLQDSLSRWVRKCQITSDRGGLICSQSIRASERALLKLATGFGDTEMAEVSIDGYMAQSAPKAPIPASRIITALQTRRAQTDTIPERIHELEEYSKSTNYAALWKQ